ncbi:MAG: amidohydrolase [Anaerolineaceae bacterium]|nr:amidohydrolase [Anaerolineaceae bacterium]
MEKIVDVLITGGMVVTMDAQRRVIKNGAVAIKGTNIVFVLPSDHVPQDIHAEKTIDATGMVIIPGMINAHGHMSMTLFRGLVEDLALEQWLEKVWKYELSALGPQSVYTGSKLSVLEMISAGITCAHDMYWHYNQTIALCEEVGFRLIAGPPVTQIGDQDMTKMLQEVEDTLDTIMDKRFIIPIMQAHSTYTTTPELMAKVLGYKQEHGLIFHTHASETAHEVKIVKEQYGMTPIELLKSYGLLDERSVLAHCVHLSEKDIQLMAESGTHVVHCPESNLKLGSGIADISAQVKAGINVCLGTDGAASNNDLNLLGEMRTAALLQKGFHEDPTALSTQYAFEMATINGAKAFGVDDKLGSLETGKRADIVLLDFQKPHLTPCIDVYANLVYAASKSDVHTVFIDGKMMLQAGEFLAFNVDDLMGEVQQISASFE